MNSRPEILWTETETLDLESLGFSFWYSPYPTEPIPYRPEKEETK
jgi:hypothetical protein